MLIHKILLPGVKFSMGCSMNATRVIRPLYFFKTQIYTDMLSTLTQILNTILIRRGPMTFLCKTMYHLTPQTILSITWQFLGNRITSVGFWPLSRSEPVPFYLLDRFKNNVYRNNP